jgi:hypothetical protein
MDETASSTEAAPSASEVAPHVEPAVAVDAVVPTSSVRVTNNLGASITLVVDVEPWRVAIRAGGSAVVPAAFWEAYRALYKAADFTDRVAAVPV